LRTGIIVQLSKLVIPVVGKQGEQIDRLARFGEGMVGYDGVVSFICYFLLFLGWLIISIII
jgi:hypothetical protein